MSDTSFYTNPVNTNPFTPYQTPQAFQPPQPQTVHPAVQQAATTPGLSLTPDQLSQLQNANFSGQTQTVKSQPPTLAQTLSQQYAPPGARTGPGSFYTPLTRSQPTAKQQQTAQQQQQQKITDATNQINSLLGNMSTPQGAGTGMQGFAQQLAGLISQLPYTQYQKIMSDPRIKNNSALSALISQYISQPSQAQGGAQGQTAAGKPAYDPLSIQTMWHDVFGPAFDKAAKIGASSGQDYVSAMNDAIAGSNLPKNEADTLRSQTKAMGALMNQLNTAQYRQSLSQPSFDTLLNAMSTAANKAALAQYEAEHQVAYGQARIFSPTGTTTAATPGVAPSSGANIDINAMLSSLGKTP